MSDPGSMTAEELRSHLAVHLRSLRAAGIEWLPSPPLASAATIERERHTIAPAPENVSKNPAAIQPPATTAALPSDLVLGPPLKDTPGLTFVERRIALDLLANEVKGCTRCTELCSVRTQTVFGQGTPGAEICFIGEAPGGEEDLQGTPFVGPAGQVLNRIIAGCGLKREEAYICNIIKCHPPANRLPLPNEAANCRGFLERQLELVKPKYIVALGGCATQNLLNTTSSIGKLRGRFHFYRDIPVLVTYHPAFLLPHRSPEKKREVWEDMKMLLTRMGRPIPGKT